MKWILNAYVINKKNKIISKEGTQNKVYIKSPTTADKAMVRKEAPVLSYTGKSVNSYFSTTMFITLFVVPKLARAVTAI